MNKHYVLNPQSADVYEDNYVIVYHAPCSDGIFSIAAALHGLSATVKSVREFRPMTDTELKHLPKITVVEHNYYNDLEIDDLIDENTTLFFVDICITDLTLLRKLCATCENVISLDHHDDSVEFAIQNIASLPENFQNLNSSVRSGAWLAWNYFVGEEVKKPKVISWVDDRDRWVFSLTESKPFHEHVIANITSLPTIQERIKAAIEHFDDRTAEKGLMLGEQLVKYRDALIAPMIKELITFPIQHNGEEYTAAVITTPYQLASEACSQLLERHHHVDIVVACSFYNNGEMSYSFRCRREDGDKIQVNKLAKKIGGGGHKAASGASGIARFDLIEALRELKN